MRLLTIAAAVYVAGLAALHAVATATGVPPHSIAHQGDSLSPQAIALGDSIFHGKTAGGLCLTCHQANAKGIPGLAPDLTDAKWLHGDGSYAFIVTIVEQGVRKPKEAAAPMLPMGGTKLTPVQVRAVASYVLSLSRKK